MKARKSGFTLVEILIVVVILGILAAIVIPQFTEASTDARTNSLMSDLQAMRSQIELYKVQHNDDMPGTFGTVTFTQAMEGYTLITGALAATQAPGTGVFGPYLQKIPANPFMSGATADDVDTTGTVGDGVGGWEYNSGTGKINADDNYDGDGDGVSDHIAL
ncbi:MAG: type IV pilin protein [Planctomycetota bacterium]